MIIEKSEQLRAHDARSELLFCPGTRNDILSMLRDIIVRVMLPCLTEKIKYDMMVIQSFYAPEKSEK